MTTQEIRKIANDVSKIIEESKATFFVKNKKVRISKGEALFELKGEISNNVGMYFFELLEKKGTKK